MAHASLRVLIATSVILAAQGSWAGAGATPPTPRADYSVPGSITSTKAAVDAAGRITAAYAQGGRILAMTSTAAGKTWGGPVDVGAGSDISSVTTSRRGTSAVAWIDGGSPRVAIRQAAGGGWATRVLPGAADNSTRLDAVVLGDDTVLAAWTSGSWPERQTWAVAISADGTVSKPSVVAPATAGHRLAGDGQNSAVLFTEDNSGVHARNYSGGAWSAAVNVCACSLASVQAGGAGIYTLNGEGGATVYRSETSTAKTYASTKSHVVAMGGGKLFAARAVSEDRVGSIRLAEVDLQTGALGAERTIATVALDPGFATAPWLRHVLYAPLLRVDGLGRPSLAWLLMKYTDGFIEPKSVPPIDENDFVQVELYLSDQGTAPSLVASADSFSVQALEVGHGGTGVLVWSVSPSSGSRTFWQTFGSNDDTSCILPPADGGPLEGTSPWTGATQPQRRIALAARAGKGETSGRERFGPIEIVGCISKDAKGRWVNDAPVVRMNGIDIYGEEKSVVFDPRIGSVSFMAGSFRIQGGPYTLAAFSVPKDRAPLTIAVSKNGTLEYNPLRLPWLAANITKESGKADRMPKLGSFLLNPYVGFNLKLAYDAAKKQGTSSLEFKLRLPLPTGAQAGSVDPVIAGAPAQGTPATSIPDTRTVPPAPTTSPLPGAPAPAANAPCSPAEDGARVTIGGTAYVCGIGTEQVFRWRKAADAGTKPPVAGQFCSAAQHAGRAPVVTGGKTLACVPDAKPAANGRTNYRWKAVTPTTGVKEGQPCTVKQSGMAVAATKATRTRAASTEGQLRCSPATLPSGKKTWRWGYAADRELWVTATATANSDDGLLPLTIGVNGTNLVLGRVTLSTFSASFRFSGTEATGKYRPWELAFAGEAQLSPKLPGTNVAIPGAAVTVGVELGWADGRGPTKFGLTLSKSVPVLTAPPPAPVPLVYLTSAGFLIDRGASDDDALQVTGRLSASIGGPEPIKFNGAEVWPLALTGDYTYIGRSAKLPARSIVTGTGSILGFPLGSVRFEEQFLAGLGTPVTRFEVEGVLDFDPGALAGFPGLIYGQAKLYGWWDSGWRTPPGTPRQMRMQMQGYATVEVATLGRVTGNVLLSNRGFALCYGTGDDLAGYVSVPLGSKLKYVSSGCDVGIAAA